MTLKQKDFIANYTDIDTITYGNGLQSYKKAYNTTNSNVAGVQGHRLLNNPKVIYSIEQIMAELGLEGKVRLKAIKKVLTGSHRQKTITKTTDKEGNEYTAVTLKAPRASDILKAADLLGKIDGTYDKNKANADVVSTELKAIFRQQRAELTGKRGRGKDAPT